jgi:glycosyltransferase involved in cell wall biosynthesis
MRVLSVTNLYPNPWQPHRAPFNRHQLRLLGERLPVQVLAPISWTDEWNLRRAGAEALPKGRRETRDGLVVDHPRYFFPPRVGRQWYGHFFQWSISKCFRRAVAEFKPTIIHAPWAYPDGWAAVRLAHQAGLPAVVQVHGSDVKLLEQFPARKFRTIEALQAADGIIAVSQDLANTIQSLGVDVRKIRVIYDGIDPTWFSPGDRVTARKQLGLPTGETILLFVGNLVPVKAVDVLFEAFAKLINAGTSARLVLIGSGSERAKLAQLAKNLLIQDRIQFQGALPQSELPNWYRAANLFVLPSHSEGVPNVLLEASACGISWVASRVGGIPEIAHLGESYLVTPNQPGELANVLQQAIANGSLDRKLPLPEQKLRTEAVVELEAALRSVEESRTSQ